MLPPGRCYPRDTLVGLLRLCASKGIHLISDEIYALSTCDREGSTPLRASPRYVPSIQPGFIDSRLVHVLYGMSKVSETNPPVALVGIQLLIVSIGFWSSRHAAGLRDLAESKKIPRRQLEQYGNLVLPMWLKSPLGTLKIQNEG